MGNTLLERIMDSLGFYIYMCIILCIVNKFLHGRADWLTPSIYWSIPWAIGRFTAGTVINKVENLAQLIIWEAFIIIITFFALAFVYSTFEVPNWESLVCYITLCFGTSMIIGTINN